MPKLIRTILVALTFTFISATSLSGVRVLLNGGSLVEMIAQSVKTDLPWMIRVLESDLQQMQLEDFERMHLADVIEQYKKGKLNYILQFDPADSTTEEAVIRKEGSVVRLIVPNKILYSTTGEPKGWREVQQLVFKTFLKHPNLKVSLADGILDPLAEKIFQLFDVSDRTLFINGEETLRVADSKWHQRQRSFVYWEKGKAVWDLTDQIRGAMGCPGAPFLVGSELLVSGKFVTLSVKAVCRGQGYDALMALVPPENIDESTRPLDFKINQIQLRTVQLNECEALLLTGD